MVTFKFSQPLQRDGSNGRGSVTLEMNREGSSCSNSNLTIETAGKPAFVPVTPAPVFTPLGATLNVEQM